ncbi:glycosyltransferase [Propioniciclava tarda]|uniref:Glycosyltransferase subfamily 4-like N-terminal domain-containing protein n=1 Tax=Propioniciclava tarda TaxID=433330 RepID=A0A4Q9KJ92_PROTD|nr:glycosyltransferase [Propioniciclava tarda]TBT94487.1 hypothetical protein ET996_10775 [Propioniciclava tarda]SMO69726.1 Glycosyltransferase involved in cell wall bisynthesis [Propioniciclava tarda]
MALITFASNNGDIGGGEEMLLALALAARELGHDVTVVAPATPDGVVRRARSSGFRTIAIKGQGRRAYLANLRAWEAAERQGLLWRNGLVPGVATAGRRNRVLHLHQPPQSRAQWAASFAARAGCLAVLCPSHDMATRLKNSWAFSQMEPTVLWNRVHDFPLPVIDPAPGLPHRIGFLGRTTEAKGIVVLAEALEMLNSRDLGGVRLVIGGDTRFADSDEQIRVDRALAKVEPLDGMCDPDRGCRPGPP